MSRNRDVSSFRETLAKQYGDLSILAIPFYKANWAPIERKIWVYALAAAPAWIFYCIVTGLFMHEQRSLELVPNSLSPVFGERVIIPGDVDSMGAAFEELLVPNAQMRSNSAAHREAQRAQEARIAEARERNRIIEEDNDGYVWRALSMAFGYPLAWLGALITLFEVRSRLEKTESI